MDEIVVVNYGMGNTRSVANAFERLGSHCKISDKPKDIYEAKGIVLPGVGAFHAAIANLTKLQLDKILTETVIDKGTPFLGICLGMQLIAEDSQEMGEGPGLGWIKGHVLKLNPEDSLRVPHVGWNDIYARASGILLDKLPKASNFFFDHSYYLKCSPEIITSVFNYGSEWAASIEYHNIMAVQFHPEKSQRNGLRVLRNFLNCVKDREEHAKG